MLDFNHFAFESKNYGIKQGMYMFCFVYLNVMRYDLAILRLTYESEAKCLPVSIVPFCRRFVQHRLHITPAFHI